MAKFDTSPVNGGTGSCALRSSVLTNSEDWLEANYAPAPRARVGPEFTRMWPHYVAAKPIPWGVYPQATPGSIPRILACLLVAMGTAVADPVVVGPPDAPATSQPVIVPRATFRPSADLDGTYLWLGPIGAASFIADKWDSTFGGEAAVVVVREHAPLGLVGANLGASRWTVRGGGRVWVDALVGTHLLGRMMGASVGPILELSEIAHPRLGASVGVWGFAGITPFVRVGSVSQLGMFAELGIHIALPVLRR